jgi:hypothetical protein
MGLCSRKSRTRNEECKRKRKKTVMRIESSCFREPRS